MWPFKLNLSQQTISGEFFVIFGGTLGVRYILQYTAKVKSLLNKNNPQVTKALSSWVGTSEAIRLLNIRSIHKLSNSGRDLKFKQWLAGLIDGDGCFSLSKKGYASLEITMDIRDERALQVIKNVYGGSIKLRSNAKALRYRLHHKDGLINLINDVNGEIRNSYRLVQLNKICFKYGITLIYPQKLTCENGWLSGFFDADGSVTITQSHWQLSLTATQKTSELLTPLVDLYGGNVYAREEFKTQLDPQVVLGHTRSPFSGERLVDNKPQLIVSLIQKDYNLVVFYKDIFGGNIELNRNGRYVWSISSLDNRDQVLNFLEYVKKHTLRSDRHKRFFLVPQFFELMDLKAHQAPQSSMLSKSWSIFNNKFHRSIHTTSLRNSNQTLDILKDSNYTVSRNLITWEFFMDFCRGRWIKQVTLLAFIYLCFLQQSNLDCFVLLSFVPIKIYDNADIQKTDIIKDNKKKSRYLSMSE
jgi:hypothetical protein